MVKRLFPMGNSLFLILLLFINVSCNTKQVTENENVKVDLESKSDESNIINLDQEAIDFEPDTLVKGFMALNDKSFLENIKLELSLENRVDFLRESPVFIFSDKNDKEYLLAYQYEGATEYEFSCFEIGYKNDLEKNDKIIQVDCGKFILGSGLELGISLKDLIKIKGDSYIADEDKIIYKIDDYLSSKFLKKYNMPSYFLECTLKDDKIVKIRFGFDYP